jgi:choice-of-anchor B domain-containing protein
LAILNHNINFYNCRNLLFIIAADQKKTMKNILICLLGLFTVFNAESQGVNVDLLSNVDYGALHNTGLNDVWGYVDENGNEYAIVGAQKGVSIVDVTDPQNPSEVYWYAGSESVWRDLKVYDDYAYITTEAQDGLLIIDLSPLPGGAITNTSNYYGPSGNTWSSAHNIYIDENGYGYIFGSNRDAGGVIMLDLFTDPMNPTEVGSFEDWYVHDGYVRNDVMYLAHVNEGFFSIVDISNKSNPIVLGTKVTPSSFAHNIWLSDDGNYVFTTDEVSDAYITAYNITDPNNIIEVDRIQSSPGDAVIPHNAHVLGDFLVTSYYADGVVIHDVSDPSNMVEIGSYDTYPGTSTSYDGNWGAYPFFPSGTLLATDQDNGLFVLGPNYTYGAKLEGNVTNSNTTNPIQGVDVTIIGGVQIEQTDIIGDYKTGIASSGVYDVLYEKYGYESQTISTTLTAGDTVFQDVQLIPIPDFPFTVNVEDQNGNPILNANVRLDHGLNVFSEMTNGLGDAQFSLVIDDDYDVTIGKWGYVTHCQEIFIDENNVSLNVVLTEGIYDDFSFDFGWSTTSDASSGQWERVIPVGLSSGYSPNPNMDSPLDCGKRAFVTDNEPGTSGNVSDGTVTLISPIFDITNLSDPYIYYERWFYCYHGYEPFNDTLRVLLSNGSDFVTIDAQGSDVSEFDKWTPVSVKVNDFITPTSTMQLFISTSDFFSTANITEAGFDNLRVTEGSILDIDEEQVESNNIKIYPNPFKNTLTIEGEVSGEVFLYDLNGKVIDVEISSTGNMTTVEAETLTKGIYILQIGNDKHKVVRQ